MAVEHSGFFYTSSALIGGEQASVEGADARHLKTVRRAKAGDFVHVCDGEGKVTKVRIDEVTADRVAGEVVAAETFSRPRPALSVFQGLAKGAKVDLVVQKLVELGVDEIVIFGAGRSVPRWDTPRAARASDRWKAIAYEAAKQSRRRFLPQVTGPVDLTEAAKMLSGLVLVADVSAEKRLSETLPPTPPEKISLLIGPEGGFEATELETFAAGGSTSFTLGPQTLRTETAALVTASLILHRYGLLG